jgi:hypothetical protein
MTAQLDGCYVIKTDLPVSTVSTQEVHDRCKDLTQVEQAFRTCKTAHLETRPIDVRTEAHRRAHGGDAGLSHPAYLEPGLCGIRCDRRRETTTAEGAEFDGNEKQRRWQLPAHPHDESCPP